MAYTCTVSIQENEINSKVPSMYSTTYTIQDEPCGSTEISDSCHPLPQTPPEVSLLAATLEADLKMTEESMLVKDQPL